MLHWIHRHRRRAADPRGAGAFDITTSKPASAETIAALAEVARLAPANTDDRDALTRPRRSASRR